MKLVSLSSFHHTMSANPLDRVAQQLEAILPGGGPKSPHLSGAETPPPFAFQSPGESQPQTPGKRRTRLACLTSGGDSAGMNAAVRAVVKMAIAR